MKVGDLVRRKDPFAEWQEDNPWMKSKEYTGVIVAVQTFEYEVYWMDGLRSWTRKTTVVKKCP